MYQKFSNDFILSDNSLRILFFWPLFNSKAHKYNIFWFNPSFAIGSYPFYRQRSPYDPRAVPNSFLLSIDCSPRRHVLVFFFAPVDDFSFDLIRLFLWL